MFAMVNKNILKINLIGRIFSRTFILLKKLDI